MPASAGIVVYGICLLIVALLGGQYKAALHRSSSIWCINVEIDLLQPLAAHLNPGPNLVVIVTCA